MLTKPQKIFLSIIFDGSITIKKYFIKELQPKSDYELMHKYSKDFYNMKKILKPLFFIRNLDTNNKDLWYESCIKEASHLVSICKNHSIVVNKEMVLS